MFAIISKEGRVSEGSAWFESEIGATTTGDASGAILTTAIIRRIFRCSECERRIEARANELTIHDCDRRPDSTSADFHLRITVESGGRGNRPLQATVEGSGLTDERVVWLLEEQGYRVRGQRFAHFTVSGEVEKLRAALENLSLNVVYEEHRKD